MSQNTIDIAKLKEALSYDPLTGVFTRISSRRTDMIGTVAGTIGPNGYRYINIGKKLNLAHRLAWMYVYGKEPDGDIDHINRDRSDNRIANLRECTNGKLDNMQNMGLRSDNTSSATGVHWVKRLSTWQIYINAGGKRINLGYCKDLEQAKAIYAEAKAKFHTFHGEIT